MLMKWGGSKSMLYFGVVAGPAARGCPVSALGLVGGALARRHRASPISQQDTSFEAETANFLLASH